MKREVRLFDELDRFAAGGPMIHAMALTFGYDGDIANERIFRPLVERFGVRHPLVIADGQRPGLPSSAVTRAGTALGVQVIRAGRDTGLFHPKLFLAIREEAVFVAIGSANLTRGGLGANLELVTPLVFARNADPPLARGLLASILAFLQEHVLRGLRHRADARTLDVADDILRHADLVAQSLPHRPDSSGLTFVHSYVEPLWEQVRRLHGDDPVEHLAVVSPFFEADDPDFDRADSVLKHALSAEGLPWSPRARLPRCTIYAGPADSGLRLPAAAVCELGDEVAIHIQKTSVEPRRLHAKLLVIAGRRRTTLLWGSPNFTPAALLRAAAGGGNVECALAISIRSKATPAETIYGELGLDDLFEPRGGPLPEPMPLAPRPPRIFEVGEALYDPVTRRLEVFAEIFDHRVCRLTAVPAHSDVSVYIETSVDDVGPASMCGPAEELEEIDSATGKRQLRTFELLVAALDEGARVLASLAVRLNVLFDDALELRQNLLLGPEAISADALLVPSTAPPEIRVAAIDAQIAAWQAARDGTGSKVPVSYQASLDKFFRNIRKGLEARREALGVRKGSRFALLRWSDEVRRAIAAAAAPDVRMPPARRHFLVLRVAEHIEQTLDQIPSWHDPASDGFAVIQSARLAEALAAVPLSDDPAVIESVQMARAARDRVLIRLRELA